MMTRRKDRIPPCKVDGKWLGYHIPALAYWQGEPRAFCTKCGNWLEAPGKKRKPVKRTVM